jgi:malate dehydrogenase (oxaloacetate-decarboxylating)
VKSTSIDTVLEVRLRHEPGTLARVAAAIAEYQGLLCEIVTVRVGDEHTQREITVETDTNEQVTGIIAAIRQLPGAEVLSTRDRVIDTAVHLAPGFAAIHLEDIRSPECFEIEAQLQARLYKPVFHDDQHGTATAVLAAIINAATAIGLKLDSAKVGVIGLGAAGTAIARLVKRFGVGEVLAHDPNPEAASRGARAGARAVELPALYAHADVLVAATGRPGLIGAKDIRRGQIVFALSNPEPEIEPKVALSAGAALASDGRAINNALAFPSLVRAAIETRARAITSDMMIVAARTIASRAERGELVPSPLDRALHDAITEAVARCVVETGAANTARP